MIAELKSCGLARGSILEDSTVVHRSLKTLPLLQLNFIKDKICSQYKSDAPGIPINSYDMEMMNSGQLP